MQAPFLTPHPTPKQVPFLEAARFAQENDLMFLEASAMTGEGVDECFLKVRVRVRVRVRIRVRVRVRVRLGLAMTGEGVDECFLKVGSPQP